MKWLQLAKDFLRDLFTGLGVFLMIVLTPIAGLYGLPLMILWRLCDAIQLKTVGWVFHALAWPAIKYILFIKPKVEAMIGKKFATRGIMPFEAESEDLTDPRD